MGFKLRGAVFVTLAFDPMREGKIRLMRRAVAKETGMEPPKYRPHITLTGTRTKTPQQLYEDLSIMVKEQKIANFSIDLVKFGLYPNPSVFSLIPTPSRSGTLRWLQHEIATTTQPFTPMFEPENWKPHVTIAKNLRSKEERNAAVRVIEPVFESLMIQAVAIGIKEQGVPHDTYVIPLRPE